MAARGPAPRPALFLCLFDLLDLARGRVRTEILVALAREPLDVGALAERLKLEVSHVSRNLQALEAASLVTYDCKGHRRVYRTGAALKVEFAAGGVSLSLTADTGSVATLSFSAAELAELEGPVVVVTPAAAPAATGSAPRLSHPPTARG